jgi:hypothetical protein
MTSAYIHYAHPISVAIAIKTLHEKDVKFNPMDKVSTKLKCSFGTSKYCKNFMNRYDCGKDENYNRLLAEGIIPGDKAECTFLHYIERRRDMCIETDTEYVLFLANSNNAASQMVLNVCGADGMELVDSMIIESYKQKTVFPRLTYHKGSKHEKLLYMLLKATL